MGENNFSNKIPLLFWVCNCGILFTFYAWCKAGLIIVMKSLFMINDWQSIFNHDVSLFFPILIKGMPRLFFCFLHQIGKKWAVKTEGRIYGCTIYTCIIAYPQGIIFMLNVCFEKVEFQTYSSCDF